MGNELTVLSAVRDVSGALSAVLNTYNSFRLVRKQEMVDLDIKIKAFQAKRYSKEAGELIRLNIQEIATTQRYIDQQNLTGYALDMAMDQLSELNTLLKYNLDSFRK